MNEDFTKAMVALISARESLDLYGYETPVQNVINTFYEQLDGMVADFSLFKSMYEATKK